MAVLGTLAGSALTFVFQRRTTARTETFARDQRLWAERIAAYSAFTAALTDFRRSQNNHWHLEQADPDDAEFVAAREDSYRLRAAATASMCRVHLVCADLGLAHLAQNALDLAIEIPQARDEQERAALGARARLALEHFVNEASTQIR